MKLNKKIRTERVIQKNEIFVWSRISKFLLPVQRYDDFKLIRITCQAACHGKTEHGIFVKLKKPSKTMMILNLSESLAKPLVMAKLNMAYLSSLKNRAKL